MRQQSNQRGTARTSLGALAFALLLLVFASPALAGPPTHLRTPDLDLIGDAPDPGLTHPAAPFNHACGTAVDSKGDVYVASAGNDVIDVFNAAHGYLTSIANANDPCGLAVDSTGRLYVSESATGNVLRYTPNAYPLTGSPTYGAPTTIDASGTAKGISVDPTDDRLYVAEGSRIDSYNPDGSLGISEAQRVYPFNATGGTYTLTFQGQTTDPPIPYDAGHAVVQAALEALSTIGAGNVSVTQGTSANPSDHLVTFTGALAKTNVEPIVGDASGLQGEFVFVYTNTETNGFSGHIGAGDLTNATGVAAYTDGEGDRYVFAADASTNQVKVFSGTDIRNLKLHNTIAGPRAGEDFGFGTAGAYLAVDPGNRSADDRCIQVADQACTASHFLVYDEAHRAVDEFEANGEFLDQFKDPAFADAEPTAMAVERSGGANDGTIYVSAGPGPGARLLAFGPLAAPSRAPLGEPLSRMLANAEVVATDSRGNVYVAADSLIHVYDPAGNEIGVGPQGRGIEDPNSPGDLAVDSTGKVYVVDKYDGFGGAKATYYTPSSYPPVDGTTYTRHEPPIATSGAGWPEFCSTVNSIAVNPSNDHVFVTAGCDKHGATHELDSASNNSVLLNPDFAGGLGTHSASIAVAGASGNVYFGQNPGQITVVNPTGTEVLARFNGAGSPSGQLSGNPHIAVDQSNGHVLAFDNHMGAAREYDASGAFVAEFGQFTDNIVRFFDIAIDNSGGPSDGNVYVAFDDAAPGTFDLTAFGPLVYGEPPVAVTGVASGLGAGNATLNGAVNPRGFDLEDCHFEYLTDATYISNGRTFAGATSRDCAESLAAIGKGTDPVSVHADLTGLDSDARYRFRAVAENRYGSSQGDPGLFGPPVITTKSALPILYTEATLRAEVDPSGLATKYHFEYVDDATFQADQPNGFANAASTPDAQIPAGDGSVDVQAPLSGLKEGTRYHSRLVAENEAKSVPGPDQTLTTLLRAPAQNCPNAEFRTGLSANLPDCRAYELLTPAETNGSSIDAPFRGTASFGFNNWLTVPRGPNAGEALTFATSATLPGFEGSGVGDGYRSERGAGAHPADGWSTEIVSPSYTQAGGSGGGAGARNGASDQLYSFWSIGPKDTFDDTLAQGIYLRTPAGFEAAAKGTLGTDLGATSQFVSPGGAHVIFSSKAHLEPASAPAGAEAIYDRAAGTSSAEVVSVKPDGTPLGAGESATYLGATEDGSALVFTVGGTLYLHRAGETVEIAAAPNTFAGISEEGKRVFYADGASGSAPDDLFACDVQAGPCAGAGAHSPTQIAPDSIFVNVSADGTHVFFTSQGVLDGANEGTLGADNLYLWDGTQTSFVAILDPQDLVGFGGLVATNLRAWTTAITAATNSGRAHSPTRSTPDGEAFAFQSHAQLTPYDNEGHGEIYRYDSAAVSGEQLACVSCDPSGAPPGADAILQNYATGSGGDVKTVIPNLTDDGQAVFFMSPDRLLPEDANSVLDVYEWKAQGAGDCTRPGGCLALISSGQGEQPSYLFSMSADGRDVFFRTLERILPSDVPGSLSLYDARVEGGIPDPPAAAPCQGDACQGQGSTPPVLPAPTSTGSGEGNVREAAPKPRCAKGKRKIRRNGKTRCVKKHQKKRKHSHRANGNRRAAR